MKVSCLHLQTDSYVFKSSRSFLHATIWLTGHKHIVSKNTYSNEFRSRKSSGHVLSIKVKLYLFRGEPILDYLFLK